MSIRLAWKVGGAAPLNIVMALAQGALAGGVRGLSRTVCFPIDTIKTRKQEADQAKDAGNDLDY